MESITLPTVIFMGLLVVAGGGGYLYGRAEGRVEMFERWLSGELDLEYALDNVFDEDTLDEVFDEDARER